MSKYMARVFVPIYLEFEATNEEDAQVVAQNWYKEQKSDWREPTVEIVPLS